MKTIVIGAGSDLGVHIDGAHLGPDQLINDIKSFYKGECISFVQEANIIKSRNLSDLRKNEYDVTKLNTKIYQKEVEELKNGLFPITLGGDHTVAIASSLADAKVNEKIGMIWFDAHTDYNTFETTVTGNMHGLPCAAITGYKCEELRDFFDGNVIQPAKTVIVGARSIDEWEKDNIKYSGITVFTTEDIKKQGIKAICDQAFSIASTKTKSIHISYDLDLIDPDVAPGVSVPEVDGINEQEAMDILDEVLNHINMVSSFDLVEFNPLRDIDRKTEQIAVNILAKIIEKVENDKD